MQTTANDFYQFGMSIIAREPSKKNNNNRTFRSFFGCDPDTVNFVWRAIMARHGGVIKGSHCQHLLWALLFMKTYATEEVLSSMCSADPKTFRKWTKIYTKEISRLLSQEVRESAFTFNEKIKSHF